MFEDITLLELLQTGGVAVWVLGVFSVVSLAVIIGRAWVFTVFSSGLVSTSSELGRRLMDGGAVEAAAWCKARSGGGSNEALSRVFLAGYRKRGRSRDEVSAAMELAARHELSRLERGLGVLGTIGSTAPFVGLFGTVIGIIRAFSDLAGEAGGGPSVVAAGVSEALVATAAGLFVAIPAVIAYNLFVRAARRKSLEFETLATEYVSGLVRAEE